MRTVKIILGSLLVAAAASSLAACGDDTTPPDAGVITLPIADSSGPTAAAGNPTPTSTHHGGGGTSGGSGTAGGSGSGSGGSGSGSGGSGPGGSGTTGTSTAPALPSVDQISVSCRENYATGIYSLKISYAASNADTVTVSEGTWTSAPLTNLSGTVGAPNAGCYGINGQIEYKVVATQTSTGLSATKTLERVGTVAGTPSSTPPIVKAPPKAIK